MRTAVAVDDGLFERLEEPGSERRERFTGILEGAPASLRGRLDQPNVPQQFPGVRWHEPIA